MSGLKVKLKPLYRGFLFSKRCIMTLNLNNCSMLNAIVIICPNEIRHDFCKNFSLLLNGEIPIVRSILETTETEISGLENGTDYEVVSREMFLFKRKPNNYYIADTKKGLNGHATRQGFPVHAFHEAKVSGGIALYDTDSTDLAKKIKRYYKHCSSSSFIHVSEILETGNIQELKKNRSTITYVPEAHQILFDHILKLSKVLV